MYENVQERVKLMIFQQKIESVYQLFCKYMFDILYIRKTSYSKSFPSQVLN